MAFPPDLPRPLDRLQSALRPRPRRTGRVGQRRWAGGSRRRPRFNRLRQGPRSRAGSALVQALMAGLIAVIGALLLASRLFSSRFNSFSRSDTLAAREAAEYGLNELQAQLNSNERGYLWVTQPNRWPVDSSSASSLLSALNTCNVQALDSSGNQFTSLAPLPAAGITEAKTIRSVNGTTISYQLRPLRDAQGQRLPDSERPGFIPPALPDQDAATLRQENACGVGSANATAASRFGNLNGGSAIITVTGTVSRGSGASAKTTTFTMSRRVHVLSPAQELKFSFIILGNAYNATCKEGSITLSKCTPDTTPPIMDPPSFGSISDISRLNVLDGNICYGTAAGCSTPLELTTIGCADLDSCIVNNVDTVSGKTRTGFCKQKVKKKKKKSTICNDNFQQAAPISMPASFQVTFQQWNSLSEDMKCDTKKSNEPTECEGNTGGNQISWFPYYNRSTAPTSAQVASMNNSNLVKGCFFSTTTTNSTGYKSAANNNSSSINCYFKAEKVDDKGKVKEFIKGKDNLIVETAPLPVNFFMYEYERSGAAYAYDLEDAGIENSNRNNWIRLRILGQPADAVTEGNPISCGKTRIINTKDNNIDGALIWLPNGWLEYAKTDSTDTSFNVIWVCKFTAPTKKDKNYQIVTPKTFNDEVRRTLQVNLPGFSSASGGTYRAYGSEDSPAP